MALIISSLMEVENTTKCGRRLGDLVLLMHYFSLVMLNKCSIKCLPCRHAIGGGQANAEWRGCRHPLCLCPALLQQLEGAWRVGTWRPEHEITATMRRQSTKNAATAG